MVGTQMISKGFHFPDVTRVGIINSDSILNFPDFRAGEKTFQLVNQAAGRAGRVRLFEGLDGLLVAWRKLQRVCPHTGPLLLVRDGTDAREY